MPSTELKPVWLIRRILPLLTIMCAITTRAIAQVDDSDIPEDLREIFSSDGIETWEAPEDMQKNYPYYLSGFDFENRPVWIVEWGKWDVRKAIEQGEEAILYKYVDQFIYRLIKSIGEKATENDPVTQLVLLYDMEGLSANQLASPGAMSFCVATVRRVLGFVKFLHAAYYINTSYVATSFINILRPLLGEGFNKFQILGTSSARWMPLLLKEIPQNQLPPWYGGPEDFKPLKVYG